MATIPSPNPIPNSAIISFNYITDPSLGTTQSMSTNTSIVTTQINYADLTSTAKKVDKTTASIGDILTYTIVMRNSGNTTANSVVLQDTVPNGTTIVNNSLVINGTTISGSPEPPGINIGSIPAGASSTVSFQVLVNTMPSPNPIRNSASTTFNFIVDPTLSTTATGGSNSNIITTLISQGNYQAIIDYTNGGGMNKYANPKFVTVGNIITYTVGLKNTGNTTADNVTFSDTIPANTTFVGNVTVNGTTILNANPNPPNSIPIGNIGPNATSTVTFDVSVYHLPSNGTIPNDSTVNFIYTADPSIPIIQSGSGNSNTEIVNVNQAVIDNTNGGGMVKYVSPAFVKVGDTVTYTIALKNTGNVTANNVTFSDTIPTNTVFAGNVTVNGVTLPSGNPNPPNSIPVGNIGPNTTSTVTFTVTVVTLPISGTIPNDSTVFFKYTVDPSVVNDGSGSGNSNTASVSTTQYYANLDNIIKSVDKNYATVGDVLTYTIAMTNSGTTSATNVIFKDTIPSGTSLVLNSFKVNNVTIPGANPNPPGTNIGAISAGSTATVSFKAYVNSMPTPNVLLNSVNTSFNYVINPNAGNTGSGTSNSNIVATTINNANLSGMTSYVNKSIANIGDILTYTIVMPNTGNATAYNAVFIDTVPTGTSLVPNSFTLNSVTIPGANPNPPGVNIGTIPIGGSVTVSYKILINSIPNPNPIVNSGSLSYIYIVDPSVTLPSNSYQNGTTNYSTIGIQNSSTNGIGYGGANSNVNTTQVNGFNLATLTKSADKIFAVSGDTITYTLILTNTGTTSANNVVIIDTIPSGTSMVPNSFTVNGLGQSGNPNPPGVNIGNLPANSTFTITFKVLASTISSQSVITNTASTSFNYITDPSTGSTVNGNANSNIVNIKFVPLNFSVTNSIYKKCITSCEQTPYTLVITNLEDAPIQDLLVKINGVGAQYNRCGVSINNLLFRGINPEAPIDIKMFRPDLLPLQKGQSIEISYCIVPTNPNCQRIIEYSANVVGTYYIYTQQTSISRDSDVVTATILCR